MNDDPVCQFPQKDCVRQVAKSPSSDVALLVIVLVVAILAIGYGFHERQQAQRARDANSTPQSGVLFNPRCVGVDQGPAGWLVPDECIVPRP